MPPNARRGFGFFEETNTRVPPLVLISLDARAMLVRSSLKRELDGRPKADNALGHFKWESGREIDARHPKPVECMRRPIQNNSAAGDAIYEPFLGSGSTLIAAETIDRVCLAVELNPLFVMSLSADGRPSQVGRLSSWRTAHLMGRSPRRRMEAGGGK